MYYAFSGTWTRGAPLAPHPELPVAVAPDGFHPLQFCSGYWRDYCPDPYNCPFGAVWIRNDHFDLIHTRGSTCGTILTEGEIQEVAVPFAYLPQEVPKYTCILPQYSRALRDTGPHYPRPYEAHHLAPYRRHLQHRVPTKIIMPASEPSTRAGTPVPSVSPSSPPSPSSSSSSSSSDNDASVPPQQRPVPFRDITASQMNVVTLGSGSGKAEKKRVSLIPGSVLAPKPKSPSPSPPPPPPPNPPQPRKPPVAPGPIVCKWSDCSQAFTDQRVALEHIKADHIKSRKFPDHDFTCRIRSCSCEGKVFEKRDNVVSHVTNVAFDIRYAVCCFQPYGCTIALKREWDLPRHKKICKYRPDGYVTEVEEEEGGERCGRKRKRGKQGVPPKGGKIRKL
ncbi:hypothetical protein TWF192_003193 [Orbilia oligospora]|uniref:C2H2-type domain-containing protein n=1 Tax=Orbilia oligospora TaxID=2813651 RepID=A0A6G1MDB4_ORBOL|nr:hypothetical protein TWF679_007924 [Orbilia oligospora]KAF3217767.1 hypothetical protein TWF191_008398 [Orbilia oligospora]KAF3254432.1 hypothetical protein TWF192_003193 [Orbilia oligospora]